MVSEERIADGDRLRELVEKLSERGEMSPDATMALLQVAQELSGEVPVLYAFRFRRTESMGAGESNPDSRVSVNVNAETEEAAIKKCRALSDTSNGPYRFDLIWVRETD